MLSVYEDSKPDYVYIDPKVGSVVAIQKFGLTFSHIDKSKMSMEAWETCIGYNSLQTRELMNKAEEMAQKEPVGLYAIIDEKGLGTGFASRIKFVQMFSKIAGDMFPEMVDKVYIINAPFIFSGLFKLVKPFLDKDLQAKIIVSSGTPRELFKKTFDTSLLPQEYGGDNPIVLRYPVDYKKGKGQNTTKK